MSSAVTVACRIRPRLLKADLETGVDALDIYDSKIVQVKEPFARNVTPFSFDTVFGPGASNDDVFSIISPMINSAMDGYNATVLAYGQTGSGKTHTITGIVRQAISLLFLKIAESNPNIEFTIKVCYLEIYMERVRDLFNPESSNLNIREAGSGVYVEGAIEEYICSEEELLELLSIGETNRVVASTGMNTTSSRSHSVLQLLVSAVDKSNGLLKTSRLSFVDLAGSEQVARTHASGVTLDEAKQINKSLFTLAKVISSLAEVDAKGSVPHIPYRDSKLTRLLQDSLGGNARTTLIVCCSPCSSNLSETVSTLRFASQARKMKNAPVVNRRRTAEELEKLLSRAESALDAQNGIISTLQQQLTDAHKEIDELLDERENPSRRPNQHDPSGGKEAILVDSSLVIEEDSGSEDAWGGGSSSDASSSDSEVEKQFVQLVNTSSASSSSSGNSEGQLGLLSSPLHHSTLSGTAHYDGVDVSELLFLRQKIAELEDDLSARNSEVSALSAALKSVETQLAEAADAAEQRTEEAVQLALRNQLEGVLVNLRSNSTCTSLDVVEDVSTDTPRDLQDDPNMKTTESHCCLYCGQNHFRELKHLEGIFDEAQRLCGELHNERASSERWHRRCEALSAENGDLRVLLEQFKHGQEGHQQQGEVVPPRPSKDTLPGVTVALPPFHPPLALPLVKDSLVTPLAPVQDLYRRLSALVHVHRQLLRKFAVVDVESADLAQQLRSREAQLQELQQQLRLRSDNFNKERDLLQEQLNEQQRQADRSLAELEKEWRLKLDRMSKYYGPGRSDAGIRKTAQNVGGSTRRDPKLRANIHGGLTILSPLHASHAASRGAAAGPSEQTFDPPGDFMSHTINSPIQTQSLKSMALSIDDSDGETLDLDKIT